ncbi:sulfhydryl oxidase 2 [Lampris incognitus]|uniref:sulfhydryl oxidase 2 n=1 Tax=Lampris incognitus TaxID=2546036 RepID=UPI0024B598BD|nr:sulfhydryl oxidase 2 [Lampris incognitus]
MEGLLRLKAAVLLCFLTRLCGAGAAALYTEEEPLALLTAASLKSTVSNSSCAWLVQFYSSWCGHCIQYSSTWKALAHDVKDWARAIRIGVLDCAQEENFHICKEYNIHFYPTFKYFRAHSPPTDLGTTSRGADRDVQTVRRLMIDFLQNHTKLKWPDLCPVLDPYSSLEVLPLLGQRSDHHTVLIIEEPQSYIGREVILDLSLYSGLVVRRVLSTDLLLVDKLEITAFPSAYLLGSNGAHTDLEVQKRLRSFFSSALRLLPDVQIQQNQHSSSSSSSVGQTGASNAIQAQEPWKEYDSSLVYMSDVESALHYLLRVELATHNNLQGEELKIFKDFVTVVAKLYPGGPTVVKLMETLLEWLLSLPLESIPYQAVLDMVDNKMEISGVFLPAELRWVGCQGSRLGLRGYPCALWTLFHILAVQYDTTPHALDNTGLEGEPAAVLKAMRGYIVTFFGCQQCGRHFDTMAADLHTVTTTQQAVLWLWKKHNLVNNRLTGSLSEDPIFPKHPWPSPSLCASCHDEKEGVHVWNEEEVLMFLRRHYGASNLSPQYLPPFPHFLVAREEVEDVSAGVARGVRGGVWILGFNSVDMSLCVFLYVSSCVFLMLLFFFFRIHSRRWKLRHSRLYV